jgi:hypothetical protein
VLPRRARFSVGDCAALGSYYRLREKTLLVVDTEDRAALEARLAEGLGEVACLYNEITPCFVPPSCRPRWPASDRSD